MRTSPSSRCVLESLIEQAKELLRAKLFQDSCKKEEIVYSNDGLEIGIACEDRSMSSSGIFNGGRQSTRSRLKKDGIPRSIEACNSSSTMVVQILRFISASKTVILSPR